jgi:hypothetical protein
LAAEKTSKATFVCMIRKQIVNLPLHLAARHLPVSEWHA